MTTRRRKALPRRVLGTLVGEHAGQVASMEGESQRAAALATAKRGPYKLVGFDYRSEPTIITVAGVDIGGSDVVIMAGPCSVESEEQIMTTAVAVRAAGATLLRGGAFKPRSSPYSFQGLGEDGLKILAQARDATGLGIITEAVTPGDIELVARYADVIQIGARNMQNFSLLQEAGRSGLAVLLKRGMSSTVEEWLLSAEYVLSQGNYKVMLCERGIRTFETATRNTFDISAVPLAQSLTHLPVIADPSHGTGVAALVPACTLAALAAGADGVILEVAPDPASAVSDGAQTLDLAAFAEVVERCRPLLAALGRGVAERRAPANPEEAP